MLNETLETKADPPPMPSDVAANLRALNQLSESNSRIAARIRDIRDQSEREILACGDTLSSIVDKARQLAEESDHAVALSMARSERATKGLVEGMREDILAQEAAVQRVLDLAQGIESAITSINDLTLSSKVLAINARIEAARLGAQGKGFAVIADSLSGLSSIIQAAADTVSSSIESVRKGLPPVSARAVSMRERTEVFINEVADQVKSVSMQASSSGDGNGRLAIITELSNQALSHLQFQDPMSQKLISIIADLDQAKDRVSEVLTGQGQLQTAAVSEIASGSEPPPGEIMLF